MPMFRSGRIDEPPRLFFMYKLWQVQSHVEVLKNDEALHIPIWANQLVAFKARAVVWFCLALDKALHKLRRCCRHLILSHTSSLIYALNSDSITIVTCSIHQRLVYFLLVFCRSTFFLCTAPHWRVISDIRPGSAACRWYKKALQLKKQWRKSLVAVPRAWAPCQWSFCAKISPWGIQEWDRVGRDGGSKCTTKTLVATTNGHSYTLNLFGVSSWDPGSLCCILTYINYTMESKGCHGWNFAHLWGRCPMCKRD